MLELRIWIWRLARLGLGQPLGLGRRLGIWLGLARFRILGMGPVLV